MLLTAYTSRCSRSLSPDKMEIFPGLWLICSSTQEVDTVSSVEVKSGLGTPPRTSSTFHLHLLEGKPPFIHCFCFHWVDRKIPSLVNGAVSQYSGTSSQTPAAGVWLPVWVSEPWVACHGYGVVLV